MTDRPLRGVGMILTAVLIFALADVATKILTERLPVGFVLAARYVVNSAILLAVLWPSRGRALLATRRTGLVLMRGASIAAASILLGHALRLMPVGETLAVVYLYPLMVVLAAAPLLKERIRPLTLVAAALGLAGVVLIARPGGGLAPAGVALALGCAVVSALYQLLSRLLARTESTEALIVTTSLVGTVVFVASLPWTWPPTLPGAGLGALLLLNGTLAAAGHFLLTAAFREAPASLIAPVSYMHLVWAAGLGWLVFGHLPDLPSAIGIAAIGAAGVAVALSSRRPGAGPAPEG